MLTQMGTLTVTGSGEEDECERCHGRESVGHYSFRRCVSSGSITELYSKRICSKCAIRDYPRLHVHDMVISTVQTGIVFLICALVFLAVKILFPGKLSIFMKIVQGLQPVLTIPFMLMVLSIMMGVFFFSSTLIEIIKIVIFKSTLRTDNYFADKLWDNSTQRERFEVFISNYIRSPWEPSGNSALLPVVNADILTCDYCGTRKYDYRVEFSYGDKTVTTKTEMNMIKTTTIQTIAGKRTFKLCIDCVRECMGKRKFRKFDQLIIRNRLEDIRDLIETILSKIVMAEFGKRKVWSPSEEQEIAGTTKI
jgi:hypothetical protein